VIYNQASTVMLASHIYFLKPILFSHRGSLQGCEVFNEAKLMYPEISTKFHSPKTHVKAESK
jgi:hypothetical protein